ncbi:T9SS type A sorting domain-containing protein [Flammeovirga sp. SubArs3]|uniref:T9SS type A sorting domain-containing protein n=1 Tax=Flammeovirga sp. SubArs3 TaxID=2995316 RepID=UPI00248C1CB8|nr:T9SS type A sorting domain-containing protein [Flammeovirga sp. SubArs3]
MLNGYQSKLHFILLFLFISITINAQDTFVIDSDLQFNSSNDWDVYWTNNGNIPQSGDIFFLDKGAELSIDFDLSQKGNFLFYGSKLNSKTASINFLEDGKGSIGFRTDSYNQIEVKVKGDVTIFDGVTNQDLTFTVEGDGQIYSTGQVYSSNQFVTIYQKDNGVFEINGDLISTSGLNITMEDNSKLEVLGNLDNRNSASTIKQSGLSELTITGTYSSTGYSGGDLIELKGSSYIFIGNDITVNNNMEIKVGEENDVNANAEAYFEGNITTTQACTIRSYEGSSIDLKGNYTTVKGFSNGDVIDIQGYMNLGKKVQITGTSTAIIKVGDNGRLDVGELFSADNSWSIKLVICGVLYIKGDLNLGPAIEIDMCGSDVNCKYVDHVSDPDFDHNNLDGGKILVEGDLNFDCHYDDNIYNCGYIGVMGDCGCTTNTPSDVCNGVDDGVPDLPVELIYFKGQNTDTGHLLLWSTASELNASHFDVEASNNRRDWQKIGRVEAAGNSNTQLKYEFLDEGKSGTYYRLAQYDFDDKVEYFGIVSFVADQFGFSCHVYPTVSTNGDELKVVIQEANTEYPVVGVFYDQQGRVISHEIIIENTELNNIGVYKVPEVSTSGVYLLRVSNGINTHTEKIVVN